MKSLIGLSVAVVLVLSAGGSLAFPGNKGAGSDCGSCHKLSVEEATKILAGKVDKVLEVLPSEVPGLWTLGVETRGRKGPLYLDFSKKHLLSGNVIDLATMESLTESYLQKLNRVDASQIPLGDAVVLGKPDAPHKVIIFDDPECPYCIKLHAEVKKVIQTRPDIAFFVKMFPLAIHPKAMGKAKAIVCSKKGAELLEDSFAGKELPPPSCETDQVDKNVKLAEKLGISSTPTLVFADGRVVPGYKAAEKIIELVDNKKAAKTAP
ncbi:MAG: DsbC family protein [Deltaproteobacteria bacterium]|nr:DsbC family protein [Deltaproteobacteria bacterium]